MQLYYKTVILLGSFLLFLIQPIAAKAMMPHFGSSISVWLTCLVFFEVMLVLGYLYAIFLKHRPFQLFHLLLTGIAVALLSFPGEDTYRHITDSSPYIEVFMILLRTVALSYFILSSNSTLTQLLYTHTVKNGGPSVYRLYSISNIGSLGALILFPLLIDLLLPLKAEKSLFSTLFLGYFILLTGLIILSIRKTEISEKPPIVNAITEAYPKSRWVTIFIYAFLPSAYLVAVTNHINLDIISLPLLWVVPLALYLVTFIIAFGKYSEYCFARALNAHLIFLALVVFLMIARLDIRLNNLTILIHLLLFFFTALYSHIIVFRNKPAASSLDKYYFIISLAGACGGIFAAIISPLIFTKLYEYFILIAFGAVLRPAIDIRKLNAPLALAITLSAIAVSYIFLSQYVEKHYSSNLLELYAKAKYGVLFILIYAACSYSSRSSKMLAAFIAIMFITIIFWFSDSLLDKRNFFGTISVIRDKENNMNILRHGTTSHGTQFLDPEKRHIATTYYGVLKEMIFDKIGIGSVGMIGMGAGTVAAYGKPEQQMDFYEIDPDIIKIAQDERYFTYLRDSKASVKIYYGDGRLNLRDATDKKYKVLIIDAFSSDSVPPHLLTIEAIKEYASKVQDDGIILMHISTRFFQLERLIKADTDALGYSSSFAFFTDTREGRNPSKWFMITKNPETLKKYATAKEWHEVTNKIKNPWTDEFYDLLGLFFMTAGDN